MSGLKEKPKDVEKPAPKVTETAVEPEMLRKVKKALECAMHPGPHWWCFVRRDKGHEGEHVPLGIQEVGLWAWKIVSSCSEMSTFCSIQVSGHRMMERQMKIA
jgi:hypothetical protein